MAKFFDDDGALSLSLSPTVTIYDVESGAIVVNAAAMVAVGLGYKYDFTAFDGTKSYDITCDAGVVDNVSNRYASASYGPAVSVATNFWDEKMVDHVVAGSYGLYIANNYKGIGA